MLRSLANLFTPSESNREPSDSSPELNSRIADVAGGRGLVSESADLPLFRPQALAAATDTALGKPIAKLPVSWTLLTAFLVAMALAFAATLIFGSYSRVETVPGILRWTGNNLRISAPMAGVVKNLRVEDGSKVQRGDVLLVVDTRRRSANGTPADAQSVQVLDSELVNLSARLNTLNQAGGVETRSASERILLLKEERRAAVAQEQSSLELLASAEKALAAIAPVAASGFISSETIRRRKEEVINLKQSVADARAAQARLDEQITEASATEAEQPMKQFEERGQLLDLIARAKRDRADAVVQQGYAITSPRAGVVNSVQVAQGQTVDPQIPVMTIASSEKGAAPTAELFVPSRAIGFLQIGQLVHLRFDAFPYQQFGGATGKVTEISSDVFRPTEVNTAAHLEEPVYRVLVSLNSNRIWAYGRPYELRNGLSLTADIVLERRSFAAWLLDPIRALRGRL